jgi:imidazolonepropionase-like amidohydrolase
MALTGVLLFAVVFGVGALPVAFLYFAGAAAREANQGTEATEAKAGLAQSARKTAAAPAAGPTVAFVNVTVVPMDRNRLLTAQTVIVEDGQIVRLGPASKIKVPRGALRVDGRGKYLMPGLADMHVHFRFDEAENLALLQLFIANGVTTVFSMHGNQMILGLRESVASGAAFGPTIYTTGPFVNEPVYTTPEQVERAVVEQKRAGYDFIKMHGDLSREAYRKLLEAARREGIRVVGHAPRKLGMEVLLEERQETVVHAEEYLYAYFGFNRRPPTGPEEIDRMVKHISEATARAGTWVIPTLTVYKGIGLQVEDIDSVINRPEVKYAPARLQTEWSPANNAYVKRFKKESVPHFKSQYRLLEKLVKGLRDAGGRLLAGTDAPVPSIVPGFSLHDELKDMVASGLTPYEALRAATANVAEFFGTSGEAGTVEVGKRADLILLDANPLKDVAATARRAGVMARGRWLPATEITRMLDSLAAASAGSNQ